MLPDNYGWVTRRLCNGYRLKEPSALIALAQARPGSKSSGGTPLDERVLTNQASRSHFARQDLGCSTGRTPSHCPQGRGLSRADLVPLLGTASRVSEVLNGKRELSMSRVRNLRERFQISADLLIPKRSRGLAA
jgi:hypothetical protein